MTDSASTRLPDYRPTKRQRFTGLNSRFDRMIKSVDDRLSCRLNSPPLSRKRMQSSSTSSVSSHDVPKTPVDAYSQIHLGKLGKNFSILKMKQSGPLPRKVSDGFSKPVAPPKDARNPLPDWLAHTFCSLEADHPLRGLLSPSRINPNSQSNTPPVELLRVSHEEDPFAFSPFDVDKQDQVPIPAYRADRSFNIEGASLIHTLSDSQEAPVNVPLPFSTPGRFASVRTNNIPQKPLILQQATFHATSTMHPPPQHLRLDDAIEEPLIPVAFSNLVQRDNPPSDFQEHDAQNNPFSQLLAGGDDSLNVYATPGPTFVCSRSVYFDSPTEDPSLSDPLLPESYDLDLNAIDFRWHPFLRSNLQERDMNGRSASPFSPLAYAIPNLAGDQSGWSARFAVDQAECGTSSEEHPPLAEDIEAAYLADQPRDPNPTKFGIVNNSIGPWSSLINNALRPVSALASDVSQSPLRDQQDESISLTNDVEPCHDGENIHTSETLPLLSGEEVQPIQQEVHGERPSTPIRQLPVTPPSAPQKVRLNQLGDIPQAPLRKTSSTLSWMIFSKRATAARHDVNSHACANLDSHDSIESWSETG